MLPKPDETRDDLIVAQFELSSHVKTGDSVTPSLDFKAPSIFGVAESKITTGSHLFFPGRLNSKISAGLS